MYTEYLLMLVLRGCGCGQAKKLEYVDNKVVVAEKIRMK